MKIIYFYAVMIITAVIKDLEELEVKMVAPSHCTGELALQCFNDKFSERYIKSGLGRKITIDDNIKY